MSVLDQNRGRKTYSFFRAPPVASPTTVVTGSGGIIVTGNKDNITISVDTFVSTSTGTFNTVNLAAPQVITKRGWPIFPALGTGWTIGSFGVPAGPGTNAAQAFILPDLVTSATLLSVTLSIAVGGTHAGGAPQNFPQVQVYKIDTSISGTFPAQTQIGSVTFSTSSYPTGASWFESGHIKELVCPITSSVVDRNKYIYVAIVTDENGTNAQSGNDYVTVMSKMQTAGTVPVLPAF